MAVTTPSRRNSIELGIYTSVYDDDGQPVRASPGSHKQHVSSIARRSSLDFGMRPSAHDECGQPVRASPASAQRITPHPATDTPSRSLLSGGARRVPVSGSPSRASGVPDADALVPRSPAPSSPSPSRRLDGARAANSLLRSGARRVLVNTTARIDGLFDSPNDDMDVFEEEELELQGLRTMADDHGNDDKQRADGARDEPTSVASIRSGARRALYDPRDEGSDGLELCSFNSALPAMGSSIVRLAAVRASAAQRDALGAGRKVLTPVRRSVRTPQQATSVAAVQPLSEMLQEVDYIFAPNVELEPITREQEMASVAALQAQMALREIEESSASARDASAKGLPHDQHRRAKRQRPQQAMEAVRRSTRIRGQRP